MSKYSDQKGRNEIELIEKAPFSLLRVKSTYWDVNEGVYMVEQA